MLRSLVLAALLAPCIARAGDAIDPALHGDWRGQAQFMVLERGSPSPLVHSVAGTVLRIQPDLAVSGISPDTGCEIRGLALPSASYLPDWNVRLDVTLSRCTATPLNRRYVGSANLNKKSGAIDLKLDTSDSGRTYEIKGTMSR